MNATNERKVYIQTKLAEDVLYDMWFTIAEKIFNRVAEVTELDEEQRYALRTIALRPNDFRIIIE